MIKCPNGTSATLTEIVTQQELRIRSGAMTAGDYLINQTSTVPCKDRELQTLDQINFSDRIKFTAEILQYLTKKKNYFYINYEISRLYFYNLYVNNSQISFALTIDLLGLLQSYSHEHFVWPHSLLCPTTRYNNALSFAFCPLNQSWTIFFFFWSLWLK